MKTEQERWLKVIKKYKFEVDKAMKAGEEVIEKGYATSVDDTFKITDKGIGFIEGKLDAIEISDEVLNPLCEFIDKLFELDDAELDFFACQSIYKYEYKEDPSEASLLILVKMLSEVNK